MADPTVEALRAAGCVYAEEEADLLHAEAGSPQQLAAMLARRVAGEPLEQVLGWAEFHGMRVRVAPGVFVPRRRTEALVHLAVEHLRHRSTPVVVDLCCGTGALAMAIAHEIAGAEVHAADLDPEAVACARRNLPPERVLEGDLYAALPDRLRGRVDVLAVNAPYVPSDEIRLMPPEARDHEHRIALDGGPDGLDLHRRVARGAGEWLAPGGALVLETSREQAAATAAACTAGGLTASVRRTEETESTVVVAISAGPPSSGTMAR